MDQKQRAAIHKHYQEEYMRAALDQKPGRVAKTMRSLMSPPLSRRAKIALSAIGTVQVGVIAGAVVVGAVVVGGIIPALIALPVGLLASNIISAPVNVPLGISFVKAKRVANEAIDKDIDNGTLVARYQADVLDKQAQSAQTAAPKQGKFFGRPVKQAFSKAAAATAKPARQLWNKLQHQPKP